ncbi:hypothetical protein Pcinc_013893 [Petrolisthes cinctipes]|uniref:Signal peptidase complex subunit 1 n=1 Tax=Petrolisthes cinctipes TaxID=88211 RepID=A0AAE1G1I9_PETCI|nr:hypothetical protein Pcinc_013893 [Petrolisthes cinctipes]
MDTFMGFSVHMDFEGQKLAERLFQIIVVAFGAVGWLYGYYVQDFFMTVLTLGAGFVLASLVTLPPWPIYRRYPLKWAPSQDTTTSVSNPESTSSKKKKK